MEGAAELGAKLVYRGLCRSKDGREPTEAEATAVDIISAEDCGSQDEYSMSSCC
jgi:hypothetical protein